MAFHPRGSKMSVQLRFYEELNDFLPAGKRKRQFDHPFSCGQTVADTLAQLGVPERSVDLVLAGGKSVDFSHVLRDGERVSLYPVFESLDISGITAVRSTPLRKIRFAAIGLPALARYLRLMGFDTVAGKQPLGDEFAHMVKAECRVLLMRHAGLKSRREILRVWSPASSRPRAQLIEVLRRLDLLRSVRPLSRCVVCNAPGKMGSRCAGCGRSYPRSIHLRRLQRFIDLVLGSEALKP